MSTRASTDITTDPTEHTLLTATYDTHGEGEAGLAIEHTPSGQEMGVALFREDAQALLEWLTEHIDEIPPRP
jgi:hypothetical protein